MEDSQVSSASDPAMVGQQFCRFSRVGSPTLASDFILSERSLIAGNQFVSSLGNVKVLTPLASLTSINSEDILYMTGKAKTLIRAEAEAFTRRQKVLTTVTKTACILVRGTPSASGYYFENAHVLLAKVDLLSQDLAVFRFGI